MTHMMFYTFLNLIVHLQEPGLQHERAAGSSVLLRGSNTSVDSWLDEGTDFCLSQRNLHPCRTSWRAAGMTLHAAVDKSEWSSTGER